jgi:predicted nuclease of restriction endonuclease-like (RecB) superfamily
MAQRKSVKKAVKRVKAAAPARRPRVLLVDLRELILQARENVARTVDSGLTVLYWHVGRRIRQDILREKRADYGRQIVSALSVQLEKEFGRGFGEKNLRRMIRFAEVFPDREIVASLMRQLTWTHFIELMPLDRPLQREFYAEMSRVERWSVRTLRQKIDAMLYERTALSRKPAELAAMELKELREEDKVTPELIFRDPYILDFLGLKDTYAEKDLERAILREMEAFILELGVGFCFVARQQRMQIDNRDYYLDLLFYHRKLRRLIAIELKLGGFEAADKGQMELYLAWLKKNACEPDEAEPLGMILCAGKSEEHIALLQLQRSGIHVASYWTAALPKKELERKLHEAVRFARARIETPKSD